jgi:hypothetical protein
MKMIKRTLIAIAVVALLATSAHAALTEYYDRIGNDDMVKVDGKETVRWPFEYKALTVCTIPVKMHVGMYVQVKDCKKKELVLSQVDCSDMSDETGGAVSLKSGDYPCYLGCVSFDVRANFDVKMGAEFDQEGDIITGSNWETYYSGDDFVPGGGDYKTLKVCLAAWKAQIWKVASGDKVSVGDLRITVKPDVL